MIWQQSTASQRAWESALSYCEGLTLADKSDWRLPNIKELGSIVDLSKKNPAIDTTAFPGTLYSNYWSSTTKVDSTSSAWRVTFGYGSVYGNDKANSRYVRCVRGG